MMTSRFPAEALRPSSASVEKLRSFQEYLSSWEDHTKGQKGFLSQSTAAGLRVTVSSVLSLLQYLTEKLGYRYLMTSRVSQDPVEHVFGIVRQSSGCNTHPTPQQFISTINCLSFNNLAHSASKGNCEPAVLHALLPANSGAENVPSGKQRLMDKFINSDNVAAVQSSLPQSAPDHASCIISASDNRLTFYIAGYVARKCLLKSGCEECRKLLLMQKESAESLKHLAQLTHMKDRGGLLYPSSLLFKFVHDLEKAFTTCFSLLELHADSILDILSEVKAKQKNGLGCRDHSEGIAAELRPTLHEHIAWLAPRRVAVVLPISQHGLDTKAHTDFFSGAYGSQLTAKTGRYNGHSNSTSLNNCFCRAMPSDAKKKRDAKKKEAVKSRNQQQQKKSVKNAANGDADAAGKTIENGDCQGDCLLNGDNMSEAERELVRRLEEDVRLNAAARACTGVLAVHPRSRDVKIDNLSITFHGVEILVDTRLELNCGQRYGLIGLNGSGKSTLLSALGRREVPIQSQLDIYHLTREIAPSEKTALQAVLEVDSERNRLEKLAEELAHIEDDDAQEQLLDVYERLDDICADMAETKAAYILHGLGFTPAMQQKKCKDFSGSRAISKTSQFNREPPFERYKRYLCHFPSSEAPANGRFGPAHQTPID
ncbi:hypothetical protein HPB51_025424 [Rhipicephalus microplus]|uniref:Uncharacterized protein n=1 Tax=Rhipicephalus microplus TaxID=6941 RepID=A0A9J6D7Y2_RHIMP|nr:hypothetical protein HPB51_025424 [Rhipicephalus microplus]